MRAATFRAESREGAPVRPSTATNTSHTSCRGARLTLRANAAAVAKLAAECSEPPKDGT